MGQETGSWHQRTSLWSHVFYFAAGGGTSLLIYRISGGLPPSVWVNFWSVVSQINSLWAKSGFALFFLILILGLQSLLLLLVWVVSLGFLVYEVGMILDAFSVWQTLSFFGRRSHMLGPRVGVPGLGKLSLARTRQRPAALAAGQTGSLMALPAPSPQPAPGLSAQNSADIASPSLLLEEAPPPERGDLLSNTMSPALPESMRWILRSPEVITQSMQKPLTEQTLILTDDGAEEDSQPIPSVKEALSRAFSENQDPKPVGDPLANPFEENLLANQLDPLANPFEENEERLSSPSPKPQVLQPPEDPPGFPLEDEETLSPLLSGYQELQSFEGFLANLFEDEEEEEGLGDDSSSAMSANRQESEPSEDPLANPFESEEPEKDPLANPFENGEPEEDLLANPFEGDPALSEPSSSSEEARLAESSQAIPFKEEKEQDDTLPSMPAIGQESRLTKVSLVPFVEGQEERPAREDSES